MMRRALLKLLGGGALAMRGTGGTPPQPPGYVPPSLPGQAPGSTSGITRARLVIVSGPSGAVEGIFIYQPGTTPGAGNGPVLSGTESTKDPFGNTVQQGWVSYNSPGSSSWAQLISGLLQLNFAGAFSPGTVFEAAKGNIQMTSGQVAVADNPAGVFALSAQANDGTNRIVQLVADQVQLPPVVVNIGTITIQNNVTITGTLSVNGSTSTSTNGLPNGGIQGNSGPASAGTAHTHTAGGYSVVNGQHSHTL